MVFLSLPFITVIHTMYVLTKDTNMSALCDVKKWIKVY